MGERHSSWIRKDKRHAIYLRDGATCAYCGCAVKVGAHVSESDAATLDHLKAHHRGGGNEATNLVTCCARCNSRKQDKTMRAWYKALADEGVDADAVKKEVRRRIRRNLKPHRATAKALIASGQI